MLKTLLAARIARLERTWGYDASYARELLDASPWTFLKFSVLTALTPRGDAPPEALAAAGLVGTMAEDCGPCTQLGVDMAARSGVPAAVLRAIVEGDEAGMGEDAALAYRFARASLMRDLEAAEALRETVVGRWGRKGLVALALALTTARMYPTLKYALGHGRACSRIVVAGEPAAPSRPLGMAA